MTRNSYIMMVICMIYNMVICRIYSMVICIVYSMVICTVYSIKSLPCTSINGDWCTVYSVHPSPVQMTIDLTITLYRGLIYYTNIQYILLYLYTWFLAVINVIMRIYLQTISNIACVVNIANITLHKYGLIVLLRILLRCRSIFRRYLI